MSGKSKMAYEKDQARRTNMWRFYVDKIVIVGVDVEVTDDNLQFYDTRALKTPSAGFKRNIASAGLIHPVKIRKRDDGRAYLVAGRSRVLAFRELLAEARQSGDPIEIAKFEVIDAVESKATTAEEIVLESMSENAHRRDESPIEQGAKWANARRLGVAESVIAEANDCTIEHVRSMLLIHDRLIPAAKEAIERDDGSLTIDAALTMCRKMSAEEQAEHLEKIVNAPRGEKKSAAQEASGAKVTKAPKMRFVKKLVEDTRLSPEQIEAIRWARGDLRDDEVSFKKVIKELAKELVEKKAAPVKKRGVK